jgi:hypothetical protein
MKSVSSTRHKRLFQVSSILAVMLVVGSYRHNSKVQAQTAARRVYVLLEGPWILVPDPKVTGGYIGIAPFMSDHTGLYVQSQSGITLSTGEYRLNLTNRTPGVKKTITSYQPAVPWSIVGGATSNTLGTRYAFHFLPPSAISEETSGMSQIAGESAASAKSLVVVLQYDVPLNSPISIEASPGPDPITPTNPGGPPDTTPATLPYTVPLGDPALIRIGSEPADADMRACSDQSQKTFSALMKLLGSTATIIYPPCNEDLAQLIKLESSLAPGDAANIETLKDVFSGKTAMMRKDFYNLVERIECAVTNMKTSNLEDKKLRDEALGHIGSILKARSVPHRDCKTPVVEPLPS